MTAKIIFVISEGRSGSTLLCQLLDQYRNVINLNESLINVDMYFRDKNKKFDKFLKTKDENSSNVIELHDKLLKDPINLINNISSYYNDTDTIVAKLHLTESRIFEEQNLNWILSQPNHKFILLERNNFLESYLSLRIAEQTKIWHYDDTTNIKFKIDLLDFINELQHQKWRINNIKFKLKNHNIDYLSLEYDKNLKNYNIDEFINLITPWFNANDIELQSDDSKEKITVTKQNKNENIFDNISNADELINLIKSTKLNINLVDN